MKGKALNNTGIYTALATKTIEQISVAPKFKASPGVKWIPYKYGREFFADKLYQLKCNSALHNSILVSRTDMVYGAGLVDKNDKKIEQLLNENETLNKIFFKVTSDYELYNCASIELLKTKGGKIAINHIPFKKIWISDYTENNQIETCWYCRDWRLYTQYKPIEIPIFKGKMTDNRMVMIISKYSAGQDYYSLPQYIGALKAIELDAEIDNFDINAIRNSFNPSLVIQFNNGSPDKTTKDSILEVIEDKYSGSSQAGKALVLFNASKDVSTDIFPVPVNDLDKQYVALNEKAMSKILIGHRIPTPLLVGIKTAGQLGASNELYEGQQIYYETVIKKDQQLLVDSFNEILSILNIEVAIKDAKPYMYNLSEAILSRITTIDEQRKMVGMQPLTPEQLNILTNGTK